MFQGFHTENIVCIRPAIITPAYDTIAVDRLID
jgi:hypothetical protein